MRSADAHQTLATWTFDRGLPQKIAGPQFNAKTGEVAIEELTIVHEGLRLLV
jgi:phage tail-like protein